LGRIIDEQHWHRCKPWIEAALAQSNGFETIEDVEASIDDGSYQFWAGEKSAAITEVVRYAKRKALNVVHGGGDLTELLDDLEPQMCRHAKRVGCDTIMGVGRMGWKRVCEPRGYRLAWVTMMKDI
jgi:S-adenosylhomocysteine hydrolase